MTRFNHVSYQSRNLIVHIFEHGDYWVEIERSEVTVPQYIEGLARKTICMADGHLFRKIKKVWKRKSNVTGEMVKLSKAEYYWFDTGEKIRGRINGTYHD